MGRNKVTLKSDGGKQYVYDTEHCLIAPPNLLPIWPIRERNLPDLRPITAGDIGQHMRRQGFNELILELTEVCNFRCKYCVYSELYPNSRTHGLRQMSRERALAATRWYLDFIENYKDHNPGRRPIVTFYGGEPLVNWTVLRDCVYFAEQYSEQQCLFLLTTNGSLVTDRVARFFVSHGILPTFSLDGPAIEHDRNRRLFGGQASHKRVMSGVQRYIDAAGVEAFVNTVYDPKTDLNSVMEFFMKHPELIPFSITPVNPFDTSYYEQFSEKEREESLVQYQEMLKLFIQVMTDPNCKSELSQRRFLYALVGRSLLLPYLKVHEREAGNQIIQYTGNCVPGEKVYVTVDGMMHACERVEHSRPIGTVERGLDYERIASLVNELREFMSGCVTCDIRNSCGLCLQSFLSGGVVERSGVSCQNGINQFYGTLGASIDLAEIDPSWIERYTSEYYSAIAQIAVRLD
ncbi:MAG: radical SAM protein [Propionibacteriaceae bacterium]|nr:radical SAM protein [Propionibacteriaceae bacterium]